MKKTSYLKYLRWTVAAVVGALLVLRFLDYRGLAPDWAGALVRVQFVPALLRGALGVVAVLLLSAFVLGRVYCSVLCPLGILQDFILRLKKWTYRMAGRKKALRVRYEAPYNVLRYSVLGLTLLVFAVGSAFLWLLLDPYSNFGRIAAGLFRPVAVGTNNLLAGWLTPHGIYALYPVPLTYLTPALVVFAGILLAVLCVLVWRKERIWCNTVCPVGTVLGLLSRYALFRIVLDKDKCTHCRKCTSACKSRCIDDEKGRVDMSRCVVCFDCLEQCRQGGVKYRFVGLGRKEPAAEKPAAEAGYTLDAGRLARRRFLKGSLLTLAALPLAKRALSQGVDGAGEGLLRRTRYPLPPGAVPGFRDKCTACQLCVTQCPSHVLRPGFMEHGLTAMMQPLMYFQPHSYCNYECTVCSEVCPAGALLPLTVERKKATRVGTVHFVEQQCVVYKKGQDCGACAEHCPTQAVHMVPYRDGLTIPAVTPELCIGCGGCESICPVRPNAIFVEGLEVQETAAVTEAPSSAGPAEEQQQEAKVTDFGF